MSNDFVSNGSRNATSDILIDGITTNEMVSGGLYTFATYTPSVDAVQEFKVQQSNFSAEYGFSGATLVNVVTRSGTNQIHGSGFEFLRNQKLDANNFFNNQNGIGLPALRQQLRSDGGRADIQEPHVLLCRLQRDADQVIEYRPRRSSKRGGEEGRLPEICTHQGGSFDSSGRCSNPNGQIWDPYWRLQSDPGGRVRSDSSRSTTWPPTPARAIPNLTAPVTNCR